jgi:hypothetical protein
MGDVSLLVLLGTLVAYLSAAFELVRRGWLLRAGVVTFGISLVPLLYQGWFTDSDAPGFGLLLMLMLPLPLLLIALGVVVFAAKTLRKVLFNADVHDAGLR